MSEPKPYEGVVLGNAAQSAKPPTASATLSGNGPDRTSRRAQERALTTSMQDTAHEKRAISSGIIQQQ